MTINVWDAKTSQWKATATDTVGTDEYPILKLGHGAAGSASQVGTLSPLPVTDYWLRHAIDVVGDTYGDTISVETKLKDLFKYGRSGQVDSTAGGTSIMTLPSGVRHEEDIYSNDIDKVTSTSSSDAGKILTVEGHTYSAGNLTFVIQDVTLDGSDPSTTAATLSTPLARATRAYLKSSGVAGSPPADLVGTIYFYDDDGGTVTVSVGVPSDTSKVHMMIRAGRNQTEKAGTSISSTDYWIITEAYAEMLERQTGAFADLQCQVRDVGNGGVWRTVFEMSVSSSSGGEFKSFSPYIIIPKNHDIRMVGLGDSATDRVVSAAMLGCLAQIV